MKIIHLVSNKVWGGGEQYVYDICRHLKADGQDVQVVHRPIPALREKLEQLDIPLYEMSLGGISDIGSAVKLANLIRSGSYILHVHNFKDGFTAALARKMAGNRDVRIIMTRHLVKQGKRSFPYRWLYRQLDRIIFVSELARNRFMDGMPQYLTDKGTVLYNSITTPDIVKDSNLRQELGIPSGCTLLMYHGRIEREKGIEILIDAFKSVQADNLHLVLLGTGSREFSTLLMDKIRNAGLDDRVHFAGFRNDVIACIRESDMGVLPSIVQEACPLSCMEYMSQGKCVITTDNGGQAEYISNRKTGILVPPGDATALSDAILWAVTSGQAEQIGREAAIWFKANLSYPVFYRQIKQIYGLIQ